MPRLQGALLDVDGTLSDSNDAHARSWVRSENTASSVWVAN